ncbi:MAG: SxtJ family membrane protein [Nitrospira sp.]|nr:SxtJ family membrane protein [Nitrospira sp.]MDH4304759.1 SxtJ family membrane protein [Nitrospira sp.]MDH5192478.1 SxtJ family membrane protein [Nitrospira sp.]
MERRSHHATDNELRQFGFLVGGVFAVIGLWPMLVRGESSRLWAMLLGSLLIGPGGVRPQSLTPVHRGWMQVGHVLGAINTKRILGILYYGLITPMELAMRFMGKDSMHRALAKDAITYRVVRASRPHQHMRNQF